MGSETLDAKPGTTPSNNKNKLFHTQASDRTPGLKTRAIFLVHPVSVDARLQPRQYATSVVARIHTSEIFARGAKETMCPMVCASGLPCAA
jgi:hypothetical protein